MERGKRRRVREEEEVMGGEVSFNAAGLGGLSKPTAVCTLCSDKTDQLDFFL